MMATAGSLRGEERRAQILAVLRRDGSAQIDELAGQLQVSEMTIRRDLDDLDNEGLVRRVRGGAVAAEGPRPFGERRAVRSRAKQAIAAKAMALLPSRGAIAIDASSTVAAIAQSLPAREPLTVATNSWENFSVARAVPGISAVVVGGEMEEATGSLVGKIACDGAESMNYQRFFFSASAVDAAHGTSEVSFAESQVKKAFARRSQQLVLCVDSSKLGEVALSATFALADIDVVITELSPDDARLAPFRELTEII
ncbi:DeoR/GlpR family DNA-binding transcription regulator [Microbacterium sp. YY-01]|uniref:DeoR/GlpR family DNA-binding transcription regulator n=1 Tax=Microbacterium sp. YY-01 TaxID=3421634 RepID=UPI003D163AC7